MADAPTQLILYKMSFLNLCLLSIYILSIKCNSPEIMDFISVDYIFGEGIKPLFMEQFQYVLSPDLYVKIVDLFELTNPQKAKEIMEKRFSHEEQTRVKKAVNMIMINYYRSMDGTDLDREEKEEDLEDFMEEYYDGYKDEL
ncbi:uncharacterized protein LOC106666380 [Cimex lectularius]|uniref:Uncharacterized protein n=1 Tax=Cimex lectularius TaxID=79782 RepID=A0A8I6THD2_CIMLE|nr:uncharacterized protein LOC106666380 [Cimex lectularius]